MSDPIAIILTGHMFTKEGLLVTAEELLLLGQSTTAKEKHLWVDFLQTFHGALPELTTTRNNRSKSAFKRRESSAHDLIHQENVASDLRA